MSEEPISHTDVTTLMGLVAAIQEDVERIRRVLEDDDDFEEEGPPQADA